MSEIPSFFVEYPNEQLIGIIDSVAILLVITAFLLKCPWRERMILVLGALLAISEIFFGMSGNWYSMVSYFLFSVVLVRIGRPGLIFILPVVYVTRNYLGYTYNFILYQSLLTGACVITSGFAFWKSDRLLAGFLLVFAFFWQSYTTQWFFQPFSIFICKVAILFFIIEIGLEGIISQTQFARRR